jgi:hypothetical protein
VIWVVDAVVVLGWGRTMRGDGLAVVLDPVVVLDLRGWGRATCDVGTQSCGRGRRRRRA